MKHTAPSAPKSKRSLTVALSLSLAVIAGAGCAPGDEEETEVRPGAAVGSNGFRFNGFRFNGFRFNGFRFNGFRFNGFRFNGLAGNAEFADWFNNADNGDTVYHAEVMKYLIGCALRADQSTGFKDKHGVTHTWSGGLGLAPAWHDPGTATDQEKQLVTACLMGHVNTAYPDPKNIMISLRGNHPSLASTAVEGATLSTPDGVFFGDLFAETPKLYVCRSSEAVPQNYTQSLLKDWGRQCYMTNDGCKGVFTMLDCKTACTTAPAGSGYTYTACTAEGRTYPAISVFVPRFRTASQLSRVGTAALATTCKNCLDFRMISGLSSTSNGFRIQSWVNHTADYALDVRYANGSSSTANLRLLVNGTPVMNGASDRWTFPSTGGADVWRTRSIPVRIPAGATIQFMGAGTTAPTVDSVAIRFQ
jgi:hypothetical protein